MVSNPKNALQKAGRWLQERIRRPPYINPYHVAQVDQMVIQNAGISYTGLKLIRVARITNPGETMKTLQQSLRKKHFMKKKARVCLTITTESIALEYETSPPITILENDLCEVKTFLEISKSGREFAYTVLNPDRKTYSCACLRATKGTRACPNPVNGHRLVSALQSACCMHDDTECKGKISCYGQTRTKLNDPLSEHSLIQSLSSVFDYRDYIRSVSEYQLDPSIIKQRYEKRAQEYDCQCNKQSIALSEYHCDEESGASHLSMFLLHVFVHLLMHIAVQVTSNNTVNDQDTTSIDGFLNELQPIQL